MRTTGSEFDQVCRREMRAALGAHCTSCELAETPIAKALACIELPVTKPPWWVILGLRWPIPVCLSCPPLDFQDPLEIVIRELGVERGVVARIVDDGGKVVAQTRQDGPGLRLAFTAQRGASYWLVLEYPEATQLKTALQPEVFSGGQRVGP
jgi:hypothetical protein